MNRTLRRVRLATPLAALVAATAFAAPSAPSPAEAEQPALLLVGDSTLAPRSGYGDALCERLAPGWACLNLARGGRSTKSYREEGLWDRVLTRLRTRQSAAPHVVLIQFGHNDQPGKLGRSTELATEFPANLRRYVEEVRAAGGLPVLGTPLTRRSFKEGRLQGDLEPWAETTRRVARELDVPLVDTLGTSAARVQALGEAVADTLAVAAKPTPGEAPGRGSNSFDRTHVGPRGACLFAALSAPLLAQAVPELRGAFASSGLPDEAACLALPPPPPAAAVGQASELHRGTYTMPGWAVGTQGGRGGRVLRVTHLQASGPGSLRAALEAHGPRNIVFEVGGVIDLQGGKLDIREPFVTIAGQTAPAPGITLIKGEVRVGTHDVIVQHLRFRPGAWGRPARSGGDQDGLSTGAGAHQVIVDHCSFSWATDENLSVGGPRFPGSTPDEWRRHTGRAITFSHNLIYEGLGHSVHTKGEHSKGTLIHDNATGILLHANLYASNRERNALFKGGVQAAMVNNLVFNPGTRAVHYNLPAGEWEGQPFQTGRIALLGNLLRHGPDTRAGLPLFVLGGHGDVELHLEGNQAVDFLGRPLPLTAVDNAGRARITEVPAAQATLPPDLRLLPVAELELQLTRAAGARPWDRDEADQKLLADVAEGRGRLIDDENQGLGYPRHAPTRRPFVASAWHLHDLSPRAGWASLFGGAPAVDTVAPRP
jgi:lysophospholipase L1-like esterase